MESIFILAEAGDNSNTGGIVAEELGQTSGTTAFTTESGAPFDQELPAKTETKSSMTSLIFMGLMFVMLYFVMFRGPKKKQQKHTQMVKSLSKNDRVQTIGGIIGTILDVKDDEITLKIDEANNTKIKITSGSIARKITKE